MATFTSTVPGRINLIGEHTDYEGGFVLPTVLNGYATTVTAAATDRPGVITAVSTDPQFEPVRKTFDEIAHKDGRWSDYVVGVVSHLSNSAAGGKVAEFFRSNGLRLDVDSTVPGGKGLSSSASLLVAALRAVDGLLDLNLSDRDIAQAAYEVEHDYIGLPCGIMDQYVCALGEMGEALLLDTRSKNYELVPLPPGYAFVVIDSGERHNLPGGDSGYPERAAQCRQADQLLGIHSLRDATPEQVDQLADPVLKNRATHVVGENARVIQAVDALKEGRMEDFGALMYASHESQKSLYNVSTPKIDEIVHVAAQNGALGARLTGGGFGGCAIALVREQDIEQFKQAMTTALPYATVLDNVVGNISAPAPRPVVNPQPSFTP